MFEFVSEGTKRRKRKNSTVLFMTGMGHVGRTFFTFSKIHCSEFFLSVREQASDKKTMCDMTKKAFMAHYKLKWNKIHSWHVVL